MRRSTITLPDDIEAALVEYQRSQPAAPSVTTVVQAALYEYLALRGHLAPRHPLHITPAEQGDGYRYGSVEHDRLFAEIADAAATSGAPESTDSR